MLGLALALVLSAPAASSALPALSLPHRMVPPRAPSPGKPPLLVLLHGWGADENDLVGLGAALDPRLLVVSPRGTLPGPGRGFAWYGEDSDSDLEPKAGLADSQQAVLHFVDEAVAAYDADPHRVYVGGFSQGAILSLRIGLAAPEKVAGVIVLSGYLLADPHRPRASSASVRHLAIFESHGRADDRIPIEKARETEAYLKTLPVKLTFKEFEGRHQIPPQVRAALSTWMSEQLGPPR
jgi:phospholipase/carboxylesterase